MLYPVGDLDVGTQAKILPHKSAGPRGERGRADGPRRYGNRQGECVRPVAVSADQRGWQTSRHRGRPPKLGDMEELPQSPAVLQDDPGAHGTPTIYYSNHFYNFNISYKVKLNSRFVLLWY